MSKSSGRDSQRRPVYAKDKTYKQQKAVSERKIERQDRRQARRTDHNNLGGYTL